MKRLFKFYVFSNLHVALAGLCLTRITELRFDLGRSSTPYFVAFSIVLSYTLIRYYEVKTNRLSWLKNWFIKHLKISMFLALLSFLGIVSLLVSNQINLKAIIVLIPFGFMTFFYVVPLLKINKTEVSFRNFPGIKIFSIAIAWVGVTVVFPLVNEQFKMSNLVWLLCIQQFFFLLAYTIPFDIRDVNTDTKTLKTLPQVFGIQNTKLIGVLSILFFLLIEYIHNRDISLSILLISLLLGIFVGFSSSKRNRMYTSFWVEATPIFWLILIVYFS